MVPRSGHRVAALLPSGRSLAVGLALLAVTAAAYAFARTTGTFAVEHIRVDGGTPAVARQVREVLRADRGSSLLALDSSLLARVEALPDVRSASYDRAFPHTLVVHVVRELPAAVLRQGSSSWLLSERGRVLRALPPRAHPRLPRLWVGKGVGVRGGDVLTPPQVAAPMRVVRALPRDFPTRVRTVTLQRGAGVVVLDGGLELRLGDARDLPLKLAVAATVVPQLAPPAAGGPAYLDVSLPERPVTGSDAQVGGSG